MNRNVFLSILALDSYNRDYGANVDLSGTSLGTAQILSRAALGISAEQYQGWQSAGFYAIAYDWSGTKVISYRGTNPEFSTDSVAAFLDSPLVKDAWNGWTLGAGFAGAAQGGLAIEFYEAVRPPRASLDAALACRGTAVHPAAL